MMGQVVTLARPHGPLSQAPIPLTERMAEDEGARMMAGAPTSAEVIAFPVRPRGTPSKILTREEIDRFCERVIRNRKSSFLTDEERADAIRRAEYLLHGNGEMEAARHALATPHLRREVE